MFSAIVRSPKLGLNPIAIVDDDERLTGDEVYEYGYKRERSAPVIAGPLTSDLIRERSIGLVVIGIPSFSRQRLTEVAAEAFAAGANVAFVPQLSYSSETSTDYVDIDGVLIASLGLPERKRFYESREAHLRLQCRTRLARVHFAALGGSCSSHSPGFKGASVLPPDAGRSARKDSSNCTSSVPCTWTRPNMAFTPPMPMIPGLRESVAGSVAPVSMNCHSSSMF